MQGFDQLIVLPPLPPAESIDAVLVQSLLASLHASPLNPSAATQRTPRPRPQYYARPDGFFDDGSWRPPPIQSRYRAPGPPPPQGVFGGGYGYRPPPTAPAWSHHLPNNASRAYAPPPAVLHGGPSSGPPQHHHSQPPPWRMSGPSQAATPHTAYATPPHVQPAGQQPFRSDSQTQGPASVFGLPLSDEQVPPASVQP